MACGLEGLKVLDLVFSLARRCFFFEAGVGGTASRCLLLFYISLGNYSKTRWGVILLLL